jgi:predicted signal transduction protein with EAL and GGDEF domain
MTTALTSYTTSRDIIAESVTATDLLRDATLAMQEAKRRGGDCVVEFFSELKTHVLRAYRYESELRAAIQNGGIEAFYQPIVDIASGVFGGNSSKESPRR